MGCESFHLQPLARTAPTNDGNATRYMPGKAPCVSPKCEECGWDFNMGGPFWTEPLHDPVWTQKLLSKLEQEKALFSAYGKVCRMCLPALGPGSPWCRPTAAGRSDQEEQTGEAYHYKYL